MVTLEVVIQRDGCFSGAVFWQCYTLAAGSDEQSGLLCEPLSFRDVGRGCCYVLGLFSGINPFFSKGGNQVRSHHRLP